MSETHERHAHAHSKTNGSGHSLSEMESLQKSFMELRQDVGTLIEHVKGTARSGVGAVRHAASSAVDGLKDRGEESLEKFSGKIEENPLLSTAIAFGAGFIVARLMGKK